MTSPLPFLLTLALSAMVSTPATADLRCTLVASVAGVGEQAGPDFIFRQNAGGSEVVWLSDWHGTLVLQCHEAIVDEFECYGFGPPPGDTPIQINIVDFENGSAVVFTALNLFFMPYFGKRKNTDTRRFAVEPYRIVECR